MILSSQLDVIVSSMEEVHIVTFGVLSMLLLNLLISYDSPHIKSPPILLQSPPLSMVVSPKLAVIFSFHIE